MNDNMFNFYGDAMTDRERELALVMAPDDTAEIWLGYTKVGSQWERVIRFFNKNDIKLGELIFVKIK